VLQTVALFQTATPIKAIDVEICVSNIYSRRVAMPRVPRTNQTAKIWRWAELGG